MGFGVESRPFRVDTHCHSLASSSTSHWFMRALKLPECLTPPRRVYELAKARGMDAVAITDHDTIDGALQLAHLADFIVGEEVTATFPEDGCPVHVVVLGITPEQHEAIQRSRRDIYELVALLKQERIAHYLAHPLVAVGENLTAWHVERLLLMFSVWAAGDAAHTPRLHAATRWLVQWAAEPGHLEALAERHRLPLAVSPRRIALAGGSDDHSGLTVGLSYTEADGVRSAAEFLEALRRGEVRPGGLEGDESALPRAAYSVAYQVLKARGLLPAPLGRLSVVLDGWLMLQAGARGARRWLPARWWLGLRRATRPAAGLGVLETNGASSSFGGVGRASGLAGGAAQVPFPLRLGERWLSSALQRAARKLQTSGIEGLLRDPGSIKAALTAHGVMLPLWMAVAQQHRDDRQAERLAREVRGEGPAAEEPSVGYFTDTLDELNGVSLTALRMADWAQRTGRALTVYGADPPGAQNGKAGGAGVRRLRSLVRFPLPAYPDLVLHVPSMTDVLLQAARHDVIHAATPGPVGLAALAAAKLLGRPFTAAYHTHLPEYAATLCASPELERWTWWAMRWFYGQADRILVPSRSVAEHLLAHGVDLETGGTRLVVFRRGVDSRRFHPGLRDVDFWRRFGAFPNQAGPLDPPGSPGSSGSCGRSEAQAAQAADRLSVPVRPVLVYVGRISREKGLDALLEVARALARSPRLREAGIDPLVALVGGGPDSERLRAQAPPNVLFTGPLTGVELARAYASADLFLFPSATDTFGNAVVEAMASGLPCLVTDVGGPQEMVRHGVTGYVLPAQAWAAEAVEAIESLLINPARRLAMAAAARAEAERRPVDAGLDELWRSIAGAAQATQLRGAVTSVAGGGTVPGAQPASAGRPPAAWNPPLDGHAPARPGGYVEMAVSRHTG